MDDLLARLSWAATHCAACRGVGCMWCEPYREAIKAMADSKPGQLSPMTLSATDRIYRELKVKAGIK